VGAKGIKKGATESVAPFNLTETGMKLPVIIENF
jgi:hypothetical protein